MVTNEILRHLATLDPDRPVASIYARTDPRDPANSKHNPAWEIALRNGLRETSARLQANGSREDDQSFRALHEQIEREMIALEPSDRGRSYAWFVGADGETIDRFTLQLPLREDLVVWDSRPHISPLVDVGDRGAAIGVVLVGREHVRLLSIEQGEVSEPENSEYTLELGDWRPYGGTASGSPQRGMQTTSHEERFEARVDEQRDKLYAEYAASTASRLEELGWERIAIACERQVMAQFKAALPAALTERIVVEEDVNLDHMEPHAIAEILEPSIAAAWQSQSRQLAKAIESSALSRGAASLGTEETLGVLAEGRVEHLLLDPHFDFSPATLPEALGAPTDQLAERAVEAAMASSAKVTSINAEDSESLEKAGGMMALLRF